MAQTLTKPDRPSGVGRFLVLDSEAIGLLRALRTGDPSSMHVIVAVDDQTDEQFVFFDPYESRDPENREELMLEGSQDGYLADGIEFLNEAEGLIAQNIAGYDALAFEKVFGKKWRVNLMEARGKDRPMPNRYPNKVMDTMVMSMVLNPERKLPPEAYRLKDEGGKKKKLPGPHSIEAHGIRMGRYKPDNEDWSKLTDHMIHRCVEDTAIGRDWFNYLMVEWREQMAQPNNLTGLTINTAYRCELQMCQAMARQAQRGFRFNTELAVSRVAEIDEEIDSTEKAFRPHMPLRIRTGKLPKPVNGHTRGSYYAPVMAITKKLPNKQWCEYRQMMFRQMWHDGEDVSADIVNLLDQKKITQKAWLAIDPNVQMNSRGEYQASVTKHHPECRGFIDDHDDPLVVGPFTPVEFEEIPLGNRVAVKQVLYKQGWLGINYNDTEQELIDEGREDELQPWAGKIDEKSIEKWVERCSDVPEWCLKIARWYIIKSRRGQILNRDDVQHYRSTGEWPKQTNGKRECRGILPRCFNTDLGLTAQEYFELYGKWPTSLDEDWRAPAEAFFCATNTFRMKHKVVVNIPSRGLYPLRDLFIAGKGKKVLGCDGAGLELRMLAHFLNDAIYQEVVLNGDIHTHNQTLAGLPLRDMAKTFIYAFLYGSGVASLAKTCGVSIQEMEEVIGRFKRELPALTNLVERIQKKGEQFGYLVAVDGRRGRIRSRSGKLLVHTMLNVLLQMTGSISMKYGLCFAERQMMKEGVGLDETGYPSWLANVHDEMQMEVDEEEVEEVEYWIESSKWKDEEKREMIDRHGRMWSAPKKTGEKSPAEGDDPEAIKVVRYYHRAGEIIAKSLTKAGEFLKLRCPLAGEYMIGDSWADTH